MSGRWVVLGTCVLSLGALVLSSTECGTDPGVQGSPSNSSGAGGSSSASGGSNGSAGASTGAAGASTGTAGASTGAGGTAGSGTTGSTTGGDGGSGGSAAGSGGATGGGEARDAAIDSSAPVDGQSPVDGGSGLDGAIFYVTSDDGSLYAYQVGTWAQVGKWTGLPILDGVRGSDADPKTGILYLTHGGAGPFSLNLGSKTTNGSLLGWSLLTNKVVFDVHFNHGVDQPAFGNGLVYVPSGEFTDDHLWYYYKASDGSLVNSESGGHGPHDSIFLNGNRYYGGTQDTYLYVLGMAPQPIKVGPSPSTTAGVRPYTVNAAETRVYITWSAFRGFSVGELPSGRILSTVNFGTPCDLAAPSHGMTLSPDGTEVYVLDTCVNQVRVYDSSDSPKLKATIDFAHKMYPGTENPCPWDCAKDGWLLHSRDGKYVYIGNSGDIIDTATHKNSAYLPTLAQCRHGFLEMMWSHGVITGTSTHVGIGY